MALSARELVLVLRARDEASRAIRSVGGNLRALGSDSSTAADKLLGVGTALLTVGTAMAGVGAVGTGFLNGAVNGAIDYNKVAGLTLTQTGKVKTSLQELKDIGVAVSKEVPIAMGDIQTSLFDIFSTIDTTIPGATKAVNDFARAAVAGDAEISTVSRTTLAALNAWQLPVEQTTKLLDTQFRLVELGAGNYQQFAQTLGLAIPTSVAAGQSFDTLSGSLAFLTRNGLTTNRAVTSTARAFELLTQPNVVKNLEGIGVAVKNNKGEFRQFDDIVTQLAVNKGWAQMTDPERKQAFSDIFGKGSIQARRFFDVAIPNFEQFNDLTEEMRGSAGAMDRAYEIMFDQPAAKVQLLKNEYEAIKLEIGDQLIPAKLKLMETISSLFDAWNKLSPQTREMIVKFVAIASIILLVVGTVLAIVGAFLMFVAIVAPVVGGFGALAIIFAMIIVLMIEIGLAVWVLIKNWDTVKDVAQTVWAAVVASFFAARDFIIPIVEAIWAKIQEWWTWIVDVFVPGVVQAWNDVVAAAIKLKNDVVSAITALKDGVVSGAQAVWDKLQEWWSWLSDTFGPGLSQIWDTVVTEFNALKKEVGETIDLLISEWEKLQPAVEAVWNFILDVISGAWNIISTVTTAIWNEIVDYIGWVVNLITVLFEIFGPTIVDFVKAAFTVVKDIIVAVLNFVWDFIKIWGLVIGRLFLVIWDLVIAIVVFAIKFVSNIIQLVLNIIQGDWSEAWQNIKNIARATWDVIFEIVRAALKAVWIFIRAAGSTILAIIKLMWRLVKASFKAAWSAIKAIVRTGIRGVMTILRGLPQKVKNVFRFASTLLKSIGKKILQGLIDGVSSKIKALKDKFSSITSLIPDWKGPADVDSRLLVNNGKLIMQGLEKGLEVGWGDVRSFLSGLTVSDGFQTNLSLGASDGGSNGLISALKQLQPSREQTTQTGLLVQGDLVLGSADDIDELDWWSKKTLGGVG